MPPPHSGCMQIVYLMFLLLSVCQLDIAFLLLILFALLRGVALHVLRAVCLWSKLFCISRLYVPPLCFTPLLLLVCIFLACVSLLLSALYLLCFDSTPLSFLCPLECCSFP